VTKRSREQTNRSKSDKVTTHYRSKPVNKKGVCRNGESRRKKKVAVENKKVGGKKKKSSPN